MGDARGVVAVVFLFAGLSACGGSGPARVEGEVRSVNGAAGGAAIEFYVGPLSSGPSSPFLTTYADRQGVFQAEVPPGDYWLTARQEQPDGMRLVGELPDNPLRVRRGRVAKVILTVAPPATARVYRGPSDAGLTGRAVSGGKPASGAFVYVYQEAGTGLRGPGYLSAEKVADDGSFRIGLHPGTYWVAVRRKSGGGKTGFVEGGDLTADYSGNPVRVEGGRFTDTGPIELHPADDGTAAGVAGGKAGQAGMTGVSGVVRRTDGPLPWGIRVLAYEHPQMIGRPVALAVVDAAGAFSLPLPAGGRYYIGARQQKSGPRRPGEVAGGLIGPDDHAVTVAGGEWRRDLVVEVSETW